MSPQLPVHVLVRLIAFGVLVCFRILAAEAPQPEKAIATDPGWPRQYGDESGKLLIYQPQVDSWEAFRRMKARFAVALTPKGRQAMYGTLVVEANTSIDMDSRTVALSDFAVGDVRYSSALSESETQRLQSLTLALFPKVPTNVSLDRVLAYMDTTKIQARNTAVSLDPPPILVSMQPAILVIIDGEPVFLDIENTKLQKVLNTNWDLFLETKSKKFYLRNGKSWLSAKELSGAWKNETKLPDDFRKLPDTEEYKEVKQTAASPQKTETVTLVIAVNKPSEIIVIAGKPVLEAVTGTELSWVSNTDCDLFYAAGDHNYYFLTSGRWFRTSDLRAGKWEAATNSLPPDFKKIPTGHPRAHVLAAVPGTRQAQDAVLMASIPQTAAIDRKTAQAKVEYVGGEPKFQAISGTNLSYATNTPSDVLRVGDSYYLCLDGVWFVASSPKGTWSLADKVPSEIYQIPSESPKHNVTYVTVQQSTPETVVYSYTPGYTGVYVSYGVAMWGTGYYYPPYYGWGYYPYPVYWPYGYYTYGASAWYNPMTGAYARGGAVYGPYGGYGRAAAYNPSTGRYSWGQTAWGPYGAAASGGFYNPNTGAWGGRAAASNGYQTWGSSVVGRGNQTARTASYSDSRGTVAGIKGSGGGAAIAARGNQGQGFAARSAAGDIYAGRDGNAYKRDQSGQWYKNNGGSWEGIQQRPTRDQTGNAAQSRSGAGSAGTSQSVEALNRDAAARSRGNYNSGRAATTRSTGSYSGSRYGGYAGRGGRRR